MPILRPMTVLMLMALWGGLVRGVDAEDWPQWRGARGEGSVADGSYPVQWKADQVLWAFPLPGKGCSTPIVWDRRIYVTAASDGRDGLLAIDWSGQEVWRTTFGEENPGKHRNGSGSNPSPVTDGKSVYVYFKSGTLAAVDLDGNVRWQTNLVEQYGPDTLFWDHGTSPVLTRDCVIMVRMHHGESWLAAFDKLTGDLRWKVARNFQTPTEGDHGYTTPVVMEQEGSEVILIWGGQHLTAHEASTGKTLWTCGDFNPAAQELWPAISSPVVVGEVAVISCGRNDRGEPRLHGVRLGGQGDVTATHRVWNRDDTGTFVTTPAVFQGKIYLLRDRGEVDCIEPTSGAVVWSRSLPKSRHNYYASPVIASGNLYAAREDGVIYVMKLDGSGDVLAEIDMQEPVIASLVPCDGRLLIRGERNLFCVGTE